MNATAPVGAHKKSLKNAGRLKFKNTKLFLETNGPATGKDQAFQKYNGSRLPANHDWTAQIGVNLPELNWTNTEQLFLAFEVFNADDIGDFLVHELRNDHNKNEGITPFIECKWS